MPISVHSFAQYIAADETPCIILAGVVSNARDAVAFPESKASLAHEIPALQIQCFVHI